MPRILYIAGYGRSGSTVLGTILGGHPAIAHIGEASFLFEDWSDPDRVCSCGTAFARCAAWTGVVGEGEAPAALDAATRRVERVQSIPRLLLGAPERAAAATYRDAQRRLLEVVTGATGKPIIVDSSKSAWATAGRALALQRVLGLDVRVLHLVRDGRSTVDSLVRNGSNWAIEGHRPWRRGAALRAAIGWTLVNLSVSTIRRAFGPGRYLRLRYEDLTADPADALRRIGRLGGFDPGPLIERIARGDAFEVGHVAGGNRVRFSGEIRLVRRCEPRERARLRPGHRFLFTLFGGWLNRRYGYAD